MAEHSMPIGELGGKSACQRIFGIIGLAKLASTSVLAVITSAEKVIHLTHSPCKTMLFQGQYSALLDVFLSSFAWRTSRAQEACNTFRAGLMAADRACPLHAGGHHSWQ